MTASANIKTPAMDVPLLPHPRAREEGEKLKKLFTSVCLSQVNLLDGSVLPYMDVFLPVFLSFFLTSTGAGKDGGLGILV